MKEKWREKLTSPVKKEIYEKVDQLLVNVYTTEIEFFFTPSAITLYVYSTVLSDYPFGEEVFKEIVDSSCHIDTDIKVAYDSKVSERLMNSIQEVGTVYTRINERVVVCIVFNE